MAVNGGLSFEEAVNALARQTGWDRQRAEMVIRADGRYTPHSTERRAVSSPEVGRIRPGAVGVRLQNGLKLMLPIAPRTKKNHGSAFGIRQSDAYRYFRDRVKEMLAPLKAHLGLPLAEARYNIAAVYFVDRYGEKADLTGLNQGLFDVLQDAGVVTNDWQFRTSDGTRIVFGDEHPRVEITITNLPQE
jgi:Holliday junction resolvase RusA-like endonuclease